MRMLENITEGSLFQTTDDFFSLIKSEEKDDRWIVYLKASSESLDQDGEVVVMKALKEASKDYLSYGVVSWDHQHRVKNDPEYIVGEPMDVDFSKDKSTLVKAFLYKQNGKAKSIWNNIQSGSTRFGASIGGAILEKAKNVVNSVIWRDLAITHKPINNDTFGKISLLPFAEFAKALMAGSGVNAATFTGGRALTPESLQGSTVDIFQGEDMRGLFSDLLKAVRSNRIVDYNDMINFVLDHGYDGSIANQLINYIAKKMPSVARVLQ